MLLYLITYDIPCNKRRKKVSDTLEGYGQRVQYSVFECVLSTKEYRSLKQKIERYVDATEDSIRCYPLSRHTSTTVAVWGGNPVLGKRTSLVV